MSHAYTDGFFDYVEISASRSAAVVVPQVIGIASPRSVLDVGCGRGVWLRQWRESGIADSAGVDGGYVNRSTLAIPAETFFPRDLSAGFDLGRRFDLAQCLEVAEHLPERSADILVESLARHADIVLFSAATPGQGGEHHVNEQPLDYWRAKFRARGYAAFDALRPRIADRAEVAPWYRFNTLIYANARGEARLDPSARRTRVPDEAAVPDLRPALWRARCAVLRALPPAVIDVLARAQHAIASGRAGRRS
jgi:hypothetical protein